VKVHFDKKGSREILSVDEIVFPHGSLRVLIEWDANNSTNHIVRGDYKVVDGQSVEWARGKIERFETLTDENIWRVFEYDENAVNNYNPKKPYVRVGGFESLKGIEDYYRQRVERLKDHVPRAGDIVIVDSDEWYARKKGEFVRIETIDNRWGMENVAHVCCGLPSGFHNLRAGYSFSGGPWRCMEPKNFQFVGYKMVTSWNWGMNGAGGGQGVYYFDLVKVFRTDNLSEPEKLSDEKWQALNDRGGCK